MKKLWRKYTEHKSRSASSQQMHPAPQTSDATETVSENTRARIKVVPKWLDARNVVQAEGTAHTLRPIKDDPIEERRESFRIVDEIYLETSPIPPNASPTDPYDASCCPRPELKLLSELTRLEHDQQQVLKVITEQSTATAQYFKGLNQRLTLLQQFILSSTSGAHLKPNCTVTLSETGIGLLNRLNQASQDQASQDQASQDQASQDQASQDKQTKAQPDLTPSTYPVGAVLHLYMVLFPSLTHLCALASVEQRSTEQAGQASSGLRFTVLAPADRQLLARHIIQRQAHKRRLNKTEI